MKFDNNKWVTNILKVVDTLNTLNGGMSSPTFKFDKNIDHYLFKVAAPGISPESMRIEVVEDKLMIYHLLDMGSGEVDLIPNILKVMPIPAQVNLGAISASYEGKILVIHMPFGQKKEGYYRSVDISVN